MLEGKRTLIVGAGSGIGRAVFDAYRAAGAHVAALELDPVKAKDLTAVDGAPVVVGDATSRDDNDAAVAMAVNAFGGLDVVINCVGLFDYYLGMGDIDPVDFDAAFVEVMDVNVRSHLLAVHASREALTTSRGTVVLTCSTSSFAPGRGGLLYVASKFALRGCVEALAEELAPHVRVNAVAPGGTLGTDLRGLRSLGLHDRSLGATPNRHDDVAARSALGVALDADDIAQSYVFLGSDAARGMTGRFLHPDGGANIVRRRPGVD